jgi:hypothetical protein
MFAFIMAMIPRPWVGFSLPLAGGGAGLVRRCGNAGLALRRHAQKSYPSKNWKAQPRLDDPRNVALVSRRKDLISFIENVYQPTHPLIGQLPLSVERKSIRELGPFAGL